jgi:DNA-binding NarL/FixJ family response regulator
MTVADLISRGWSNAMIAHELGISVRTVEAHVHSILLSTGFRNRGEVARWFVLD